MIAINILFYLQFFFFKKKKKIGKDVGSHVFNMEPHLMRGTWSGLADCVGAIAGGYIYEWYGPVWMFRGSALAILLWMLLFQFLFWYSKRCHRHWGRFSNDKNSASTTSQDPEDIVTYYSDDDDDNDKEKDGRREAHNGDDKENGLSKLQNGAGLIKTAMKRAHPNGRDSEGKSETELSLSEHLTPKDMHSHHSIYADEQNALLSSSLVRTTLAHGVQGAK
ncbi:hypothetical protein RFI_18992 [Reticulomyxa filosa]|uniref:Uncharacterized protein n=1 Tax=Reticulomyxa filosa TaxID=46433 RepID=X6MYZ7_RETFI|nr:hypothetical protein RFI_18992 [Reticulomyxa filosa]|eukprot:ETO18285.1 hypothetical protein RFI_18992 [Reticulomyxa filosa]